MAPTQAASWSEQKTGKRLLGFPAGPQGLMHRFFEGFLYPSYTGSVVADIMDACETAWNRFTADHALIRSLCAVAWAPASPSGSPTAARIGKYTSVRQITKFRIIWARGYTLAELVEHGYEGSVALLWDGFAGNGLTRESIRAELGSARESVFACLGDSFNEATIDH
jgi:hypothetical protein